MSAITPLAPQRAARIATQLMDLIELKKLSPGDKLPPERQLADLLAVSRPSLREALHILQAQGLVQIKHGQGTFAYSDGSRQDDWFVDGNPTGQGAAYDKDGNRIN